MTRHPADGTDLSQAAYFDTWALGSDGNLPYDRFIIANRYRAPRLLHALLPTMKPGTAIDFGCGTGASGKLLIADGWTVDGLDFSQEMVVRARKNGYRNVTRHDLRTPPKLTQRYDLAISVGVAGDYLDPEFLIDQMTAADVIALAGEATEFEHFEIVLKKQGFRLIATETHAGYEGRSGAVMYTFIVAKKIV